MIFELGNYTCTQTNIGVQYLRLSIAPSGDKHFFFVFFIFGGCIIITFSVTLCIFVLHFEQLEHPMLGE